MAESTSPAKPSRSESGQTDLLTDTIQACGFSDKYIQSKDVGSRVLGHGGSSASIERCFSAVTGDVFAVKRLSSFHDQKLPYLAQNEVQGLLRAGGYNVPRVVKFVESFKPPAGGTYLILEFVDGSSLSDCLDQLPVGDSAVNIKLREGLVLEIAAQMLQTVYWLHMGSRVVHLDITSSNVMLLPPEECRDWDDLRLLDFGFAQPCSKDAQAADIEPQGATAPYAAPELLRSLQLQYEGANSRQPGVLINGCAADWWATGIVLYELLTGELPFITCADPASAGNSVSVDGSAALDCAAGSLDGSVASDGSSSMDGIALIEVPESVPPRDRVQWAKYQAMLQAQQSWVDAGDLAHRLRSPVQHSILDRVRQCSANPDEATSFFLHVFSLVPHERAMAKDTHGAVTQSTRWSKTWGFTSQRKSLLTGDCVQPCVDVGLVQGRCYMTKLQQ